MLEVVIACFQPAVVVAGKVMLTINMVPEHKKMKSRQICIFFAHFLAYGQAVMSTERTHGMNG
jgi:hypothetical protein